MNNKQYHTTGTGTVAEINSKIVERDKIQQ